MKNKYISNHKWQVSFSDLLTILLCFFVALIAHGSFKEMKSGTAFAESGLAKNNNIFKEVFLSSKDIEQGKLLNIGLNLKKDVNLDSYTRNMINISSCKGADLEKAKANLTEIERQISDMNLNLEMLSFELGRTTCLQNGVNKKIVAKVNIDLKN